MSEQIQGFYEFGPFRVDAVKRVLLRDGEPVPLKPKVFDTLLVMVANSGRDLEKDELMRTVWPDTAVEENNLTQNISAIRKALGERRGEHLYVVTIPGRGYRFVAEVSKAPPVVEGAKAVGRQVGRGRIRIRAAVAAMLLLALVAGLLVALPRLRHSGGVSQAGTGGPIESIAVLPFKPLGAATGEEYVGQGMADALITKLSNTRRLTVRPTSAVLGYDDLRQDPLEAGRELGVDSVLDGKFQRSGDRVRVTVQLLRVGDGATLWAETFDQKLTDIFDVQDSISEQVTKALTIQLSGEERERMGKRYTRSAEAYQAFLKGHYFMNKGTGQGDALYKSIDYFNQAISLDPNYATAYAGLSDSYSRLGAYGVPPSRFVSQSREAAAKALLIDETIGYAHSMLGRIAFKHDWDFPRAEQEYRRARELDPSLVHQWYAFYLLVVNRTAEADVEIKRFAAEWPLLIGGNTSFGLYYYYERRYGEALEQIRKTIEMDAAYPPAREALGLIYEQQGMYKEAVEEFQKAVELSGGSVGVAPLGHIYALMGRRSEARAMLRKLAERSRRGYVSPAEMAQIHAGLGEKGEALNLLEKAYAEHSLWPPFLRFDPRLDSLRAEPRFKDLLRRAGLSS